MKFKKIIMALACLSSPLYAEQDQQLLQEIQRLQKQTQMLQSQLNKLQKKMVSHHHDAKRVAKKPVINTSPKSHKRERVRDHYHSSHVTVHAPESHPESIGFYPTALVAENRVVTYIAGTPVVSSPYLGDRPAFDGSDYIVNISRYPVTITG